ncbi:MAG: hypothetical protein ACI9SP_004733 [Arenicella sp.]|jgi:hypothetical protein
MNKDELIRILLNRDSNRHLVDDLVPEYLSEKYDREGAVLLLSDFEKVDAKILNALCIACLSDCEEDVRLCAFEGLIKHDLKIATVMAYSLIEDDYEDIVELASECIREWNKK